MSNFYRLIINFMILLSLTLPYTVNAQEPEVSDIVSNVVQSTLSIYKTVVVKKLEQDGLGASADYTSQKGFVSLPEEFMRRMAINAIAKHRRSGEKQFTFTFAPGGTGLLSVKLAEPSMPAEQKALVIAKVLDGMIRAVRGTYTSAVIQKLRRDGAGAAIDHTSQKGFVPLPAVFMRLIAADVISKAGNQFFISLRSRWNLNREQELRDDFERAGWTFLAKQQETQLAAGKSLRNFHWEPYVQVVTAGAKKNLRYISADPAASRSCVTCHNAWENREDIKTMRAKQDVEVGKTFKQHELLGVLSIVVSLED
ncbi:MAG: DUF3365 domain-containing protein [Candidatus Tectomicrobia bacterium]|nr:DUF3365 domain-containing protein [Candidatus Tectomicrobia bacterium]